MNHSRLIVTDGTTSINLLSLHGWLLQNWSPTVPEPKGGGVFRNSSLVNGRKLVYRKVDNIIDTFNLVGDSDNQNLMIVSIQELQRLLEKSLSYWTSDWQKEPVWIEARAPDETEIRYAVIVDYRFTGFGGPFQQPFFSINCNSATEATLLIEHTFWQETKPGEDGECVEISSEYMGFTEATVGVFHPAASNQDETYSPSAPACDMTDDNLGVGRSIVLGGYCESGVIFDNVTVPAGAIISIATLYLTEAAVKDGAYSAIAITLKINGQVPPTGGSAAFSGTNGDFADQTSRLRTINSTLVPLAGGEYPGMIDVTSIIQEIVDNATAPYIWVAGDDLCLFVTALPSNGGRDFASYDYDGGSAKAELIIEYVPPINSIVLGRAATCAQEVYISNKQSKASISDIYYYDDSLDTWSNNLLTEALPYNLLPDPPEVDDCIYFGSNTTYTNSGPFGSLIFDLSIIQVGVTGIWEYYSSLTSDFEELDGSTGEVCGDEQGFTKLGVGSVVFEQKQYWESSDSAPGAPVWAYWIRFRITDTGTVPPKQQNRHVYTVLNPYVDIDSLQVPGDIPALARILLDSASCYSESMNVLIMGLRSLARGEDFSAYLNASDTQQPTGITFTPANGAHLNDSPLSATGRRLHLEGTIPSNVMKNVGYWTVTGELANQYQGVYHAYLRVIHQSGFANCIMYQLSTMYGEGYNTYESGVVAYPVTPNSNLMCLDMGIFNIMPFNTMRPNDSVESIYIYLDVLLDTTLGGAYTYSYIHDLILIPADEWIGNFTMPLISGSAMMSYDKGLDIDAITNPRQYRATEVDIATDNVVAEWTRAASGEPIFQSNADQRLWFLQNLVGTTGAAYSHIQVCGALHLERSARYLLARGNR